MPPPQPYGMNNAGMSPAAGMGMGMGNYYYPGGGGGGGASPMLRTAPLAYPSPLQPSPMYPSPVNSAAGPVAGTAHSASAATVPGYPNRYYPRQLQPPRAASASPKSPEGVPSVAHWAEDVAKYHLVEEASVNKATLTAHVDQLADEEKRLFLEEYRYAGTQAVSILSYYL